MAAACSTDEATSPTSPRPGPELEVVTTIYPVTYFSERIGGERVDVRSLVKPGVDAHDFVPTPGDIIDIRNADILVYTDPSFEVWVEDALDSFSTDSLIIVRTADLTRAGASGPDHEGTDPHVWLNPLQAVEQVRAIQAAFGEADPAGAEIYRQSADTLVAELLVLDAEFASSLGSCALAHIVVSHEAYGHLAERYSLEQIGLADFSAEFETTPRRIADIIDRMMQLGIGYILQEPILSDDLAKTVARETGAEILPLHPLESLTPAEVEAGDTYFTVMHMNLESLRKALICG